MSSKFVIIKTINYGMNSSRPETQDLRKFSNLDTLICTWSIFQLFPISNWCSNYCRLRTSQIFCEFYSSSKFSAPFNYCRKRIPYTGLFVTIATKSPIFLSNVFSTRIFVKKSLIFGNNWQLNFRTWNLKNFQTNYYYSRIFASELRQVQSTLFS